MLTTAPQLFTYIETAIGTLLLAGDGEALSLIGFPSGKMQHRHKADWQRADAAFTEARLQLDAYFGGELKAFDLRAEAKHNAAANTNTVIWPLNRSSKSKGRY